MAYFGGELVVSPSNWWKVFSHLNESTFRITEDWNLLGGRSDGAGGPDRTTRAYAFSLPLAA
jgi:hypothetical protein